MKSHDNHQDMTEAHDKSQKTVIIATLSFIIGFGLAWLIASNKTETPVETHSPDDEDSAIVEDVMTSGGNSIAVSNQVEGVQVVLDAFSFENPGWAVIHEDSEGAPGRILGAQLFDFGAQDSGTVELLRGTLAGQTYYAMLHSDNGDHAFDPKLDLPLTNDEGKAIMATFIATGIQAE